MSEAKGQEWLRDNATVYRLNKAGTNGVYGMFSAGKELGQITAAELAQHSMNAMESAAARLNVDPVELSRAMREGEGIAGMVEALKAWMEFNRETLAENPCPDYALRARLREEAKAKSLAALAAIPKPTDAA